MPSVEPELPTRCKRCEAEVQWRIVAIDLLGGLIFLGDGRTCLQEAEGFLRKIRDGHDGAGGRGGKRGSLMVG
jgi:hypothetical protein